MVTPEHAREPPPLEGKGRYFLLFGWPIGVGMAIVFWGIIAAASGPTGPAMILVIVGVAFVSLVTPVNAAIQAHTHIMSRVPRRMRKEPLFLMIPRSFAIPALAALGSLAIATTLLLGGCIVLVATFRGF